VARERTICQEQTTIRRAMSKEVNYSPGKCCQESFLNIYILSGEPKGRISGVFFEVITDPNPKGRVKEKSRTNLESFGSTGEKPGTTMGGRSLCGGPQRLAPSEKEGGGKLDPRHIFAGLSIYREGG